MKEVKTQFNIPKQYSGYRKNLGIADALRELEVGQCIAFPFKARSTVGSVAAYLGIKVVTRGLGSRETVFVWRIE